MLQQDRQTLGGLAESIHCNVGTWEPRAQGVHVSQGGRWLNTTWEKTISSISSFLPRRMNDRVIDDVACEIQVERGDIRSALATSTGLLASEM